MDNFIYGCIEGSYAQGMQTENSDLDIIEVYNAAIHMEKELKKVNDIKLNQSNASRQIFSSQSFIYNLFYEPSCEYYRWLFPYKYLSDNELTTYIKKYNEDIIKENLPYLYQRLMQAHDTYMTLGHQNNNYKYYYKSLDKYVLLIEYKKFKSYQESLFCKDYKQLLLDIKLGKYTKKQILNFDKEFKKQIDSFWYMTNKSSNVYQQTLINLVNTTSTSNFYI